jgi:hypothetical protein
MGKRLAVGLIILALLGLWLRQSGAASDGPQLSDAGLYEVNYEIDKGGLRVKSIRLAEATQEIAARPGVAFGVCCPEQPQPLQAGYVHPEGAGTEGRFWGVETSFNHDGRQEHFYGFIFEKGSRPEPGTYAVALYRAEDGSLVARQLFKVVAEAGKGKAKEDKR